MKILNLLIIIALLYTASCFKSSLKISNTAWSQQIRARVNAEAFAPQAMAMEAEDDGTCIQPDFLKEETFQYLMAELRGKTPDEMMTIIPTLFEKAGKEMLSPRESLRLFTEIDFGDRLEDVLVLIRDYLWLSSEDLKNIVMRIKDLDDRVKFVVKLFPMMIDQKEVNLEILRDQLDCGAKDILDQLKLEYKPRDCFFGDLSGNTVFVIDLSGSMLFSFLYKREKLTRLAFLKRLFERAISSLTPEQKFQIITFNTYAKYLFGNESSMYSATSANKKAYISAVNRLNVGYGDNQYTNISGAIQLAMNIKYQFKRVIFFSDGGPTVGITGVDRLKNFIQELKKKRTDMGYEQIPFNVNMLMLGGTEGVGFRNNAKFFSKLIATETDGVVKNYDSNTS